MTTDQKSPKHFARLIRDHLKALPEGYAEDPKTVQNTLGLSDEEFKMGIDLLIERKIIVMEKAAEAAKKMDTDETVPAAAEVMPAKKASTSTMEMAAVGSKNIRHNGYSNAKYPSIDP